MKPGICYGCAWFWFLLVFLSLPSCCRDVRVSEQSKPTLEVRLRCTMLLRLKCTLISCVCTLKTFLWTFNVLSPWSAAEKGWRTHLYRTGSRMFRGKRNLKLEGVNRAWWALSGSKKSTLNASLPEARIWRLILWQVSSEPSPPPGILRKSPEDQEARSSSGTPRSFGDDAEFGDE